MIRQFTKKLCSLRFQALFYQNLILKPNLLNAQVSAAFFAKKVKKVDKKKERAEKARQETAKEFEGQTQDSFMKEAQDKFDGVFANFKTQLKLVKISKSSPKALEKIPIYVEGQKASIRDYADISIKSADTICILPRDYAYIDPIMKGLNNAKLDMQFNVEEKMIIGRIEKSQQEMKQELIKQIRRLEERTKNELRTLRGSYATQIKRLKNIVSVDDVRKLMGFVDMQQSKFVELIKRYGEDKEQEIRDAE